MPHYLYTSTSNKSSISSHSSQFLLGRMNDGVISIMDLTNQELFEAGGERVVRAGQEVGGRREGKFSQAQGVAQRPQQPVVMDAKELEKALQVNLQKSPGPLESSSSSEDQHYSSFNPFSLSNSNSNADAWEFDYPYGVHSNPTPPQAQAQPQLQHQHQPVFQPFTMDPNDHGQYYYHQPGSYSHYAHSYAPSSGPSNPTSPQNGFVPIYSDTPQVRTFSQYSASTAGPQTAPSPQTLEEHELKRLRNTAASARFRAKKKQREAQLESAAREKKERLEALEKRIHDLEEENKWLKALIMEKKDVAGEVARLRERFGKVEEEMREFESSKDGVGTGKGGKGKDK